MKIYIEAYDGKEREILGNLDGQGVIRAINYKRTKLYKALKNRKTLNNRVKFYRLVTPDNRILETVYNNTFKEITEELNYEKDQPKRVHEISVKG